MKQLLLIFVLILNNNIGHAQLVKTPSDSYKIEQSQQLFINKPLKDLIKEIKPPIKMLTASHVPDHESITGFFMFKFVDSNQADSLQKLGKIPITIVAYVKEKFEWNARQRMLDKKEGWLPEDEIKYGDLTVMAFRIYGEE